MSTPTPIEIVRAHRLSLAYPNAGIATQAYAKEIAALDAVLRDAERYKALELAHDGRSVYAMCIESHDQKARFTGYDLVACPLAELADRLKGTQ